MSYIFVHDVGYFAQRQGLYPGKTKDVCRCDKQNSNKVVK